jgi:chitodextrinase
MNTRPGSLFSRGRIVAELFLTLCIMWASSAFAVSVTYVYDSAGRLQKAIYDNGMVVTYLLDAAGNRKGVVTAPPPGTPGTPVISAVTATTGTATWTAPTTGSAVTGYEYSINSGASWINVANVLATNLSGLSPGTGYTFTVRAYNAGGTRGGSTSAGFTTIDNVPPTAPGIPTISNVGGNTATASWAAATDNVAVTGYEYTLNGGASWTGVGTALSVNLTGLTAVTGYTFSIRAFDATANRGPQASKSFTTVDNVPPTVPGTPAMSNITVTTATASWSAASDNVGVTGYEYSLNGGTNWTSVGTALSVNLAGLSSGVTYTFSVRAFDAIGNRGPQASKLFTTVDNVPPTAPGIPVISSTTATTAAASWSAASDNVGVTGYEYSLNGGTNWISVGTALSVNLTGLSSGVSYTFRVRAFDAVGLRGSQSSASFTTVDNVAPTAPGTPQFSAISGSSANVSWSASTDNVAVTGYEFSINGGASWNPIGTFPGWSLSGLSSGVSYTFHVRAFDAIGLRGPAASASFTTLDVLAPTTPGALSFSSVGASSFTVSWGASSDNVGVTGYRYSLNSGASWTNVGNVLSTTVTGLSGSTTYTVNVQAGDAMGFWSLPRAGSVTTTTATDVTSMTVGQSSVRFGYSNATVYGTFGAMSPTTLTGGVTLKGFVDVVNPFGPGSAQLFVSGFSADPGASWLISLTARGITRTSTNYSYSAGLATWTFSCNCSSPFSLPGTTGQTMPITLVHK